MPTGPSTLTAPYLLGYEPNVTVTSIATVGDIIGTKPNGSPYLMAGIPDGLGAFDNGDGTFTLLMNHELTSGSGVVRAHGAAGAFVSQWVIDKTTLQVLSAHDAIQELYLYNDATQQFVLSPNYAINRLCSADLAPVSAYHWVDDMGTVDTSDDIEYGTQSRIYMTGEEGGQEGKEFAVFVTGPDAGKAYEFADCGLFAWENNLASPFAQRKTITIGQDDGTNGQVYVYVGEKQSTGSEFQKAGLEDGHLYGIKVTNLLGAANSNETDATAANGRFTMYDQGVVGALTGAQLDAQSEVAGVTSFQRPEDGHWDPTNPNVYYFVTTASFTGQSRLYKMTFDDITNPEQGGTIEAVLDSNQLPVNGGVGPRMMDNITVTDEGKIIIEEDPGNNAHLARMFEYDPVTDTLTVIAVHNGTQFVSGQPGFLTQDEEASGVIDVTALLGITGGKAYLTSDQIHTSAGSTELVEKGQLSLITVSDPVLDGTAGNDDLRGSAAAESFHGNAGNDSIRSGSGNDTVEGGEGDDTIDGGAGTDTAVYAGNLGDYLATRIGNVVTLAGAEGTDTVTNVESFQFANGLFSLGAVGNVDPALTGTPATLANGTEDTAYTVSAATLLQGYTDANGDTLSVANLTASNGTVVVNGNGTFTITPTANYNGPVTLTYDVTDGFGGTVAASAGYALAAVNDAPALTGAQAVLAAGTEDTAAVVSLAQFLQGFTDADGDTLSVSGVSADHGTVTDNLDGTWTVTPAANYNGALALSYTVADGNGGSVAGSLAYNLTAVNDAPYALALSNSTIPELRATNSVVGTLITSDVDNTSGFTYTMLDGAGGRFYVNGTTGVVSVGNGPLLDFETASSHTILVQVRDAGGATYQQSLTINLTNVVENQTYEGTSGNDTFTALTADNWTVNARAGNDTIVTIDGNDSIFAGGGNDSVSTGAGNDLIYFTGSAGFDSVDGGIGTDTVLANASNTIIGLSSITGVETISSGGFANVRIQGSSANNVLDFSGATMTGIASINGGAGNDTIIGSLSNDTIVGAAGGDMLSGGAGADTFVFKLAGDSTVTNSDHILDFVSGVDKIDLSGIDAIAVGAGNQAFTFIGSSDFTGLGQLRIGMVDGHMTLSGNVSGNLAADFVIVLDSNPTLQVTDFIL